jgi:hypothetical protein
MREWHLLKEDLPSLIVAADARLSSLNYYDDQIWELNLESGEPAALTLQTTYGLRARSMRMFPRFVEGDEARSDPNLFPEPPAIHRFFPNYILVTFSPFPGIDVVSEYWVPGSNVVAGRLRVINSGVTPRHLGLEWVALLVPANEGHRMSPEKIQEVSILQGQLQQLSPVCFMTGGVEAKHSPYPSLSVKIDLLPGLDRIFTWSHAALPDPEGSFTLARSLVSRDWDAEYARIEMTNASIIEVETGKPAWDLAFSMGQKTAINLIHGPTDHLPQPSFVQTRLPNQGFSLLGDGTDYDHLWDGQSPLESWYLSDQLIPLYSQFAKGFILNFLATQDEIGYIDLKPGLNGKSSGYLATPILCSLAWRIFQSDEDQEFLEKVFSGLVRFFQCWFSSGHDQDADGIPEWDHPAQSGFEDNPLFANWRIWSPGGDIKLFISPPLAIMLYREARSLIQIAQHLGRIEPLSDLERKKEMLKAFLDDIWRQETASYPYLDSETRSSSSGKKLVDTYGSGVFRLGRFKFHQPARLAIRVKTDGERARDVNVRIRGTGTNGNIEEEIISISDFRWLLDLGVAISKSTYHALEQVQIEDVQPEDRIFIRTLDFGFHDQTLLLPLWAGVPSPQRAKSLIKKYIMRSDNYWRSYGLPACLSSEDLLPEETAICEYIWMPWNSLIGQGLVAYGYRELAAELVARLMDAIVETLRKDGVFRKNYHVNTGLGFGERNALSGLPPLALFLDVLGVYPISPWKVGLNGKNPFPWEVKINFRGMTVHRGLDKTEITFPDEQTIIVEDPSPCVVNARPN